MRQTILDHVTFGPFTAALPDILGSVECSMLHATNSPHGCAMRYVRAV